ncbi:FecCD family ABC transporter permease [Allostreptomyces psammosilenae]|uniref:Iron complex transport system permease protein n=1 Tax=Allostreptomyces psammosilenae TaxID=1892865 RepID=A0A853A0M8_9ACTN|nr:iron chelate uptake ABC transporter family permease subunit [Allostreptomyces psammosilenae]NYI07929.1 iron complex transport system permease protein [Allostreptomyces psammosilenae]
MSQTTSTGRPKDAPQPQPSSQAQPQPQPRPRLRQAGWTARPLRLEAGPIGVSARPRVVAAVLALAAVVFAGLVASVSLGQFAIPAGDVVRSLFGGGPEQADLIVHQLRLPRALTAVLVGLAFGLAGAVFQAVTRNPLASPDLIGISAGASVGGVGVVLLAGVTAAGAGSYAAVPFGALVGALAAAAVIYLMAYRGGAITGYRFVVVGLAMQGALTALNRWMLARADIDQAGRAMVWLTGSLNGRGYEHVRWVGLALLVLVPLTLALIRPYQLLQYDDDTALGLGMPIRRARIALLTLGVALAAAATAAAGPISFVALASAQIARRITGTGPIPLVTSGLVGAALLLVADLAGRLLFAPIELPVGIVTGVIGAPYLMWLLARANRAGKGG